MAGYINTKKCHFSNKFDVTLTEKFIRIHAYDEQYR